MQNNTSEHSDDCSGPLTTEELEHINNALRAEQRRRDHFVGQVLRVLVDGSERTRFNIGADDPHVQMDVPINAQRIEVEGQDEDGDLLLASHLLEYTGIGELAGGTYSVALCDGRALKFDVDTQVRNGDIAGTVKIALSHSGNSALARAADQLRQQRALTMAYALLIALVLWSIWFVRFGPYQQKTLQLASERQVRLRNERDFYSAGKGVPTDILETLTPLVSPLKGPSQGLVANRRIVKIGTSVRTVTLMMPIDHASLYTRYRAILEEFDAKRQIVINDYLTAIDDSGIGPRVNWVIPSDVLKSRTLYLVTLQAYTSPGQFGDIAIFDLEVSHQ